MRALLFALLLAGCAQSTADLASKGPAATFPTSRAPNDVATCLADAFAEWGAPLVVDIAGGKRVTINNDGGTALLFVVEGGSVTVYQSNRIPVRKEVQSCA